MSQSSSRLDLLKSASALTPWVAPIPSAFFVARSAVQHLDCPLPIAILLALVIELLGLTGIHTWLRLSNWNLSKRKSDPPAPAHLGLLLAGLYAFLTLGMILVLDVLPSLAHFMPAVTPLLALVGAFNLALLSQQEQREAAARIEREQRKAARADRRSMGRSTGVQENVQKTQGSRRSERSAPALKAVVERSQPPRKLSHEDALNALVRFFERNPSGSYSAAGRSIGRSKSWVAWALNDLEKTGRLRRTDQKGIVPQ